MSTGDDRPQALSIRANKLDILERLADDLAHEIKNPLHSMVINLEVLKRRVSRWNADEQNEVLRYIGVLGTELERVNQRIELLLRLARPARSAESSTLDEPVSELLELVQLEGRRHEVEVRFEPTLQAVRIHAPREPLRQVVLDLILEALDRIGRGGVLHIGTGRDSELAFVQVSGIDREGQPVPFTDPDPATDAVDRLAVARAIAQAIGGSVDLASVPTGGEGSEAPDSRIVFSLPAL
ncbi:MAG: hypothetical protein JO040_07200 [Gemmatimonadetes bacterium]|nr:hypothetical protein [Gemmatimonadota bacterium]